MFRCSREQFLAANPQKFWPEFQPDGKPTLALIIEAIKAALRGDDSIFEIKHLRYDGSVVDSELTFTIVKLHVKNIYKQLSGI